MISVIIPLFNEADNLVPLWQRLEKVLRPLGQYEVIFIDDGSVDGSLDVLKKLYKKYRSIRIFSFRKNRGKAEALTFGFQAAKGEKIITMDADLQDQPEEIPSLIKKLDQGYDMVSGWKKNRKDGKIMVSASRLFNSIMRWFWKVPLHDFNCGLKIYTKDAAQSLQLYGGMYRFIPLLLVDEGFSVSEIPTVHDKRLYGKSKYGFSKVFKDLPDLLTMFFLSRYGRRPLHFFGTIGSLFIAIGTGILIYLWWLHAQGVDIGRRPLPFIGIAFITTGFQIFFTGFIADLLIHLFYQPKPSDMKNEQLLRFTTETKQK